jgi:hypothetical protein
MESTPRLYDTLVHILRQHQNWVSRRYRRKIYCQRFRKMLLTVTGLIPSPRH